MGIKKNSKGEISIENVRGRIRLRWRYEGIRYSLNLPNSYHSENLHHAIIKVAEIKLDILKGGFDSTLQKYTPNSKASLALSTEQISESTKAPKKLGDLPELFSDWCKNYRNVNIDQSLKYLHIKRYFEKLSSTLIESLPQKLNGENWVISTYNEKLSLLKQFFTWLLESGILVKHPLKDVRRKRNKRKKKNPRRLPLEENEISAFLNAIKADTYCPSASRFKHSFYYPFLTFIFYTGVRNAEAIGLRVKHVNFELGHIEIAETLARTAKGAHHSARILKGTKTENVRYLPLSNELRTILLPQVLGKGPNDLLFHSPKGLSIDDRMLNRRIIKPVLMKLGYGKRDLYSARHSFGTRAVKQGIPLTEIAYLMGHSTIETAVRNYISVDRRSVNLPTLKLNE
jgi:integrase